MSETVDPGLEEFLVPVQNQSTSSTSNNEVSSANVSSARRDLSQQVFFDFFVHRLSVKILLVDFSSLFFFCASQLP